MFHLLYFEVIYTQRIFDLPKSIIGILIHEKSYVHAILKFNDGMIKIVAHETTMEIPITVYWNCPPKRVFFRKLVSK